MAKQEKGKPSPEEGGSAGSDAALLDLIGQSGFIFRGKVVHRRIPDPPELSIHTEKIRTVEVGDILLSTRVLRSLQGREVTVISEHPLELHKDSEQLFFTNCLSLGDQAIFRELSHIAPESIQHIRELVNVVAARSLRKRVQSADLIVEGKVLSSHAAERSGIPRSEHDPEWWIALVKVQSLVKGGKGTPEIEVLFANSKDIAWYKSPKLHEGDSGILLLRLLKPKEVLPELDRTVYQAIDPLDFQPSGRLQEIQSMLNR
jgi:hypothetical protein